MALLKVYYFSSELGMCMSSLVVLPQRKQGCAKEGERFKTLWLLHGRSDDETIWERRTSIERYVSHLGLAVVMPCAHLSAYADMAHGGRYYSYIAKELPAIMRGLLPLSDLREDNYIAGLSMGGAGAMKIGLANCESYCAIGCLSAGGINLSKKDTPEAQARANMLYGDRELGGTEEDVFENARAALADHKLLPRIYHSCGAQDFILPSALSTRDFFMGLMDNPFGYVYEQDEGTHCWEYWDVHIQRFLEFIGLKKQDSFLD